MKCLVVVAHPLPDSLCRSLARFAVERLEAAGPEVTLEDLYGDGFGAALTEVERRHLKTFDELDFDVFSHADWARLAFRAPAKKES